MAEPGFVVRWLLDDERPQWNAALAAAPEGSPYQRPEYLDALAEAIGGEARYLAVFRRDASAARSCGELVGGLGFVEHAVPFGRAASTRLLLYYCAPFVRPAELAGPYRRERHRGHVLEVLEARLRALPLRFLRLKAREAAPDYRPFLAAGWRARPYYSYLMRLDDLPARFARVDANLRRLVRRCADAGMRIEPDGDVDAFLEMHAEIHRRKGTSIYLWRDAFRRFIERTRDAGLLSVVDVRLASGEIAASQLVLAGEHPVSHTIAAGAYAEHQATGCNAFLRWKSFEWLAGRGYAANDLTDAHNPGVAKFKAQLGAELVVAQQLEWSAGYPPGLADRYANVVQRVELKRGRR